MTETNNGKVVDRNIALALGVVCIILAAGLAAAVANGTVFDSTNMSDLENQVAEQTTTISNLNAKVTILQNQLNTLNSSVSDYETQLAELTDENSNYASILALNDSAIILDSQSFTQDANTTTILWNDTLGYAGYVEVKVQSSSNSTYINAAYTYAGLNYNQTITVGVDGTAYFPILPGTIDIQLGNISNEANNGTVTLTYYY